MRRNVCECKSRFFVCVYLCAGAIIIKYDSIIYKVTRRLRNVKNTEQSIIFHLEYIFST